MKRTWIGAALLVLLIAGGLLAGSVMERRLCPVGEKLRAAGAAALDGDWEKAEALTDLVRADWADCQLLTAGLAAQDNLEQIDMSFAQLSVYAGTDGRAYSAICAALAEQLEALGKSHRYSWENLL